MDSVEQSSHNMMQLHVYEATWEVDEYKCILQILHIILIPPRQEDDAKTL